MSSSKLEITNGKVRNPITKRFVSISGHTYAKLVRDKILDVSKYETNQVIYAGPNAKEFLENVNKDNLKIPSNKTLYTRGDKVMTRNKRVSKDQIKQKMRELTIELYKDNKDLFKNKTPEEVVDLVNQLVMERMVEEGNNPVKEKMLYIAENLGSDTDSDSEMEEFELDETDGEEEVEVTDSEEDSEDEGDELLEDGGCETCDEEETEEEKKEDKKLIDSFKILKT